MEFFGGEEVTQEQLELFFNKHNIGEPGDRAIYWRAKSQIKDFDERIADYLYQISFLEKKYSEMKQRKIEQENDDKMAKMNWEDECKRLNKQIYAYKKLVYVTSMLKDTYKKDLDISLHLDDILI
ncbi:hypothetical protein [Enterococcus phage vB_EfaS_140]|uniref:Uncharacterized protein n=1 Tax=Enterococcus phage vB_EfaS_140 TaxID=2730536 RepID=A0ACA9ASD5_9CAUD|nr:hypothetical protein [Enterococcus phage vB_EfaS_140]